VRPIVVDTNAYAAFMLGDEDIVEVVAHAEALLLPSVVLGELLGGFALGKRARANREELARFMSSPRVTAAPISARTAESYALVYLALRRRGRPIPTNDLWIAASTLEHGAALLTRDAHFSAVEGLQHGSQLADFLL
jgi:tRNA(fMet)-specific endonuclease VapC